MLITVLEMTFWVFGLDIENFLQYLHISFTTHTISI